ncbi:MAG TPA: zf-TFIIB domain-containing protein [Gemmatimonadaceae bacterium]|nr:zf-TFIIB domain-containing protein [Gemmatimonadaceae bacterium]
MPTASPTDAATLRCPSCGAPANPDESSCGYCRSRLAAAACPSCFALAFRGTVHCPRCGAALAREERGEAARDCPRCRAPMSSVRVGEVALSECGRCEGIWLDPRSFERLCSDREAQALLPGASREAEAPARADVVRYLPCPCCGGMMNRVNFARSSGVVLDVCREHGTFFDRDELHRTLRFIREGGLDRARAREREALREERRRLELLHDIRSQPGMTTHYQPRAHADGGQPVDLAAAGAEIARLVRALFG